LCRGRHPHDAQSPAAALPECGRSRRGPGPVGQGAAAPAARDGPTPPEPGRPRQPHRHPPRTIGPSPKHAAAARSPQPFGADALAAAEQEEILIQFSRRAIASIRPPFRFFPPKQRFAVTPPEPHGISVWSGSLTCKVLNQLLPHGKERTMSKKAKI